MTKRGRRAHRRQLHSKEQKRRIRVLTEGAVTEQSYLREFCAEGINLEFAQTSGFAPLSLVQRARQELKQDKRSHVDERFDDIWCVFDRDEHPHLKPAIQEARDAGINIAFSNPCFELWLVWHLENQSAHVERRAIQRRCQDLGLIQGKQITKEAMPKLRDGFPEARHRAKSLDKSRESDGTEYGANPHSDVWRLVELLQENDCA